MVDGYAAFTPEESARYGDAYLPPFIPGWDGAHLRWLWARMREQKYFFPWYDGSAEAAMAIAPQSPRQTHEAVRDVLDVGDHYRSGYAAAFRHNDHHWLAELAVPAWLVYRHDDPLRAHLPRLQGLPGHVRVVDEPGGIPAMQRAMEGWLQQTLAGEADAARSDSAAATVDARETGWTRAIFAAPGGDLALWQRGGAGVLNVLLHSPGERPWTPERIAGDGAWLLPDLPGHGASSESGGALGHDLVVDALLACIASVPAQRPLVLHAHGAAAGYVPALAEGLGARVREVPARPLVLDADAARVAGQMPTVRSTGPAATCVISGSGSASATCCGPGCRRAPMPGGPWRPRIRPSSMATWSSCCAWARACDHSWKAPPRRASPTACGHWACRCAWWRIPPMITAAVRPRCCNDPDTTHPRNTDGHCPRRRPSPPRAPACAVGRRRGHRSGRA